MSGPSTHEVGVAGIGLFCPAGIGQAGIEPGAPGEVPGFRARDWVANRKNLKLMTRAVQLGVAGAAMAVSQLEDLESVPPHRRAMYVGSNPLGGDFDDLRPALEESTDAQGSFDLARFASDGIPLIHPLWLVKGLSNNVLGFASAQHDFQGANANYCQGTSAGLLALWEGAQAVLEDRAELALAGSADSLLGAEGLLPGRRLGEGAAFFVLRQPRDDDRWRLRLHRKAVQVDDEEEELGFLGVAGPVVALARAALSGRLPVGAHLGGHSLAIASQRSS